MPNDTAIGWTHHPDFPGGGATWNVGAVGCLPCTDGCLNCYASSLHNKWHGLVEARTDEQGQTFAVWKSTGKGAPLQYLSPFGDVHLMNPASVDRHGRPGIFSEAAWQKRLNWPKTLKQPTMIFANSMTDWLISDLPESDILAILDVCAATPQHVYQFLTKRTGRLRRILAGQTEIELPPNVWIGQSLEQNKLVKGRLGAFPVADDKAAVRFLSCEPLLDDLTDLTAEALMWAGIDWVIVGAESGKGARTMQLDWVRRIRDSCGEAGAAFFFKQTCDEEGRKDTEPLLDGVRHAAWPALARCVSCKAVIPASLIGEPLSTTRWGDFILYLCEVPGKATHYVCSDCNDADVADAYGRNYCSGCADELRKFSRIKERR